MEGICGGSGGATAYAKPEQRTARTGLMAAGLAFLMPGLAIGAAGLAFLLQSKRKKGERKRIFPYIAGENP